MTTPVDRDVLFDMTAELLEARDLLGRLGTELRLERDVVGRDDYGRLLLW